MLSINKKNKKIIITLLILALLGVTLVVSERLNITNFFGNNLDNLDAASKTTSTEPSAQADFSEGSNENKGEAANSLKENKGSAVVSDQRGAGATPTTNPITSQDGNITLFTPGHGAVLKSGASLSGSSKLSLISYRIIDSASGVIASGELRVVEGKFSGTITFDTAASEGRLDIYATKTDGTEFSNIEVPIKFQ